VLRGNIGSLRHILRSAVIKLCISNRQLQNRPPGDANIIQNDLLQHGMAE